MDHTPKNRREVCLMASSIDQLQVELMPVVRWRLTQVKNARATNTRDGLVDEALAFAQRYIEELEHVVMSGEYGVHLPELPYTNKRCGRMSMRVFLPDRAHDFVVRGMVRRYLLLEA